MKELVLQQLQNGIYDWAAHYRLRNNDLLDDEVKLASKKSMIHKLENKVFDWEHVCEIKSAGYLDDEIKAACKKLLLFKIEQGFFDVLHTDHAIDEKYIFDADIKELAKGYIKKYLKTLNEEDVYTKHRNTNRFFDTQILELFD